MDNTDKLTYRDLIRIYSEDVARGRMDTNLTKRQRFYCSRLLNLSSNYGLVAVYYPPTDDTRDHAVRYMAEILWFARALLSNAEVKDLDIAAERANVLLRNI